ncbi:efflux RND transporter periplasmic adaptor subunit [Salinisphaera hydrothermalis]|uniref:Cation efflux family protein n=1 Tax=Salinisphaera hydrothermalis (strain C41B8) TaxID=1304275 RepID=A0A084IGV6_SALHC|nr:efflux RND transporter periplasmic adaptor subunit [Salinisphaera hydrothermalis]KEZ75940.1 cation efflux family protein [Salinisphaera hydrothermalis C41B8]
MPETRIRRMARGLFWAGALTLATIPMAVGAASAADASHADENGSHASEHKPSPRTVHLSAEQRDRLKLAINKAPAGTAEDTITAPADVRFDADRVAAVGPRLASKVVSVEADLGDRVDTGDTLAILDSVALGKAKADYLTARAHYANARATYRRKRGLADDQIISQAALDEARAQYRSARAAMRAAGAELRLYGLSDEQIDAIDGGTDAPLSRFALRTPKAGVVQRRDVVAGKSLSSDDTPFQVVDTSKLWVMLQVSESKAAAMRPGLPVSLEVRALPGRRFSGQTDWVSASLDAQNRTLTARAVVDNRDGRLAAGMFGTATVQTQGDKRYALVPTDAVQTLGDDEQIIFVPGDEDGAFRAVAVATGHESNGRIEIREGLAPGDEVVTAGAFDLMSALTSGSRSAAHGH